MSMSATGKRVVAIGDYSGTYKATGKAFKAPFAHVWKLRGGAVVGFQQFTDTAVCSRPCDERGRERPPDAAESHPKGAHVRSRCLATRA